MATTTQEGAVFKLGNFELNFPKLKKDVDEWMKKQHPAVEVLAVASQAALQGGFFGYFLGALSSNPELAGMNGQPSPFQALQAGGPWGQAKIVAVFSGVNAGLSSAIKKARKGVDDVWGEMAAAFGAGVALSLASPLPNPLQTAFTTGCIIAAFNGAFGQIRRTFFPPEPEDDQYERAKYVLSVLGLKRYEKNLKNALLTDDTIMLWTDSALIDARIPPGPRLKILHHLDQYRVSNVLKPALPIAMPYPTMAPMPLPAPALAMGATAGDAVRPVSH